MANNQQQMSGYRRSFQDVFDARQPQRQARQEEARTSMGNAYKKDITQYDYKSHGSGKFDHGDIRHLRKQGYTDDQIAKYSSGLGKDHLSEGVRQNNRAFAGQHAYQDMAKGHKITDHDVGRGFNISDVKYLRSQGYSDKDIAKHAHKSVTQGGKRHGNAMAKFMDKQGYLDYYHGDWKAAKGKAQGHINNSGNTNTEIKNTQEQNVTQNNDINNNISGDNNKVFNEQDNSIRQYGGDNRSLVINGGGKGSGNYYSDADQAITMGTLGGFYAPDDSPAAQAKFSDMYSTLNRDAQKRYSNVGVTTSAKYSGFRGGDTNIVNLQKRIDKFPQQMRDLATLQEVKTYGDRAAKTKYPAFEFGAPIEEITSNAGNIASGYRSDIDNM